MFIWTKNLKSIFKILRIFKSSMSFSLKHFFISVTFSTKVASAPLSGRNANAPGGDNTNDNPDNNIFTIKDTKLYVPVVLYQQKTLKKYQNFLAKDLKDQFIENEYRYFLESNFVGIKKWFVLVYSNQDDNAKRFKARWYYLPKGVIKNCNVIISGKNFYDQPIHSDVKRCKKIRKLTTDQD